jgi:hypothetical protein
MDYLRSMVREGYVSTAFGKTNFLRELKKLGYVVVGTSDKKTKEPYICQVVNTQYIPRLTYNYMLDKHRCLKTSKLVLHAQDGLSKKESVRFRKSLAEADRLANEVNIGQSGQDEFEDILNKDNVPAPKKAKDIAGLVMEAAHKKVPEKTLHSLKTLLKVSRHRPSLDQPEYASLGVSRKTRSLTYSVKQLAEGSKRPRRDCRRLSNKGRREAERRKGNPRSRTATHPKFSALGSSHGEMSESDDVYTGEDTFEFSRCSTCSCETDSIRNELWPEAIGCPVLEEFVCSACSNTQCNRDLCQSFRLPVSSSPRMAFQALKGRLWRTSPKDDQLASSHGEITEGDDVPPQVARKQANKAQASANAKATAKQIEHELVGRSLNQTRTPQVQFCAKCFDHLERVLLFNKRNPGRERRHNNILYTNHTTQECRANPERELEDWRRALENDEVLFRFPEWETAAEQLFREYVTKADKTILVMREERDWNDESVASCMGVLGELVRSFLGVRPSVGSVRSATRIACAASLGWTMPRSRVYTAVFDDKLQNVIPITTLTDRQITELSNLGQAVTPPRSTFSPWRAFIRGSKAALGPAATTAFLCTPAAGFVLALGTGGIALAALAMVGLGAWTAYQLWRLWGECSGVKEYLIREASFHESGTRKPHMARILTEKCQTVSDRETAEKGFVVQVLVIKDWPIIALSPGEHDHRRMKDRRHENARQVQDSEYTIYDYRFSAKQHGMVSPMVLKGVVDTSKLQESYVRCTGDFAKALDRNFISASREINVNTCTASIDDCVHVYRCAAVAVGHTFCRKPLLNAGAPVAQTVALSGGR